MVGCQDAGGAKFSAQDGDVAGAMLGARASCMTLTNKLNLLCAMLLADRFKAECSRICQLSIRASSGGGGGGSVS